MFTPNLDAYFARIGYAGPRTATPEVLRAIHAAHARAIPYENLDILLGREIRIDLASIERKLVHQKRGGYCFEQNCLLAAALRALGFRVTPCISRVRWQVPNDVVTPLTHLVLLVDCADRRFLSDVGGNYRWPDGTYTSGSFAKLPPPRRGLPVPLPELYEIREKIFQDHLNYQQGLYHFLANDPQVPEELRERVKLFGLDPKEFPESGHWPHQLYIREGRRMVSDYIMTQANCQRERVAEDSIGLASYPMDSHFCQRVVVVENGKKTVRNEGGFGSFGVKKGPYPVSYRSIVPKKQECGNLLVPVALSASHAAFGSIRMEPVFMILGQSAGTAAVLAIDSSLAVQDVPYTTLKELLLKQGQRL